MLLAVVMVAQVSSLWSALTHTQTNGLTAAPWLSEEEVWVLQPAVVFCMLLAGSRHLPAIPIAAALTVQKGHLGLSSASHVFFLYVMRPVR